MISIIQNKLQLGQRIVHFKKTYPKFLHSKFSVCLKRLLYCIDYYIFQDLDNARKKKKKPQYIKEQLNLLTYRKDHQAYYLSIVFKSNLTET